MKLLLCTALLASSGANAANECTQTDREHYNSGWKEARSVERIQQAIEPGGHVGCKFLPDPENRLNVLARFEQGTLDGVAYQVQYADGSAVIQGNRDEQPWNPDARSNWRLRCPQAGTGRYHCTLSKGDLRVQKGSDGAVKLAIGENHRADSQLLLRVDDHLAISAPAATGFSADQIRQLLAYMRVGKKADTQYHPVGLQGAIEKPMSLYGFSQAEAIMDKVLTQLGSSSSALP